MLASDFVVSMNVMLPNPIGVPSGKRFGAVLRGAEFGCAPIAFDAEHPAPGNPVGSLDVASGMHAADHAGRGVGHAARRGKNSCRQKSGFIRILSCAGSADISPDIATGPAVNGDWLSVDRRRQVRRQGGNCCQQGDTNACERKFFHETPHHKPKR